MLMNNYVVVFCALCVIVTTSEDSHLHEGVAAPIESAASRAVSDAAPRGRRATVNMSTGHVVPDSYAKEQTPCTGREKAGTGSQCIGTT